MGASASASVGLELQGAGGHEEEQKDRRGEGTFLWEIDVSRGGQSAGQDLGWRRATLLAVPLRASNVASGFAFSVGGAGLCTSIWGASLEA